MPIAVTAIARGPLHIVAECCSFVSRDALVPHHRLITRSRHLRRVSACRIGMPGGRSRHSI